VSRLTCYLKFPGVPLVRFVFASLVINNKPVTDLSKKKSKQQLARKQEQKL
jgi:hypothetical protein